MDKQYEDWYEAAKAHAGNPKGLLAPDDPGLIAQRWSAALYLLDHVQPGTTLSLLDVGCGYADLADKIHAGHDYTGIEAIGWIAEEAIAKHPHHKIKLASLSAWSSGVVKHEYDVVVALGVMATLAPGEEQQFAEDLVSMAKKAVILSYQDAARYKGKFRAFTNEQVMELFATPIMVEDAIVPAWDTQNWVTIRLK